MVSSVFGMESGTVVVGCGDSIYGVGVQRKSPPGFMPGGDFEVH